MKKKLIIILLAIFLISSIAYSTEAAIFDRMGDNFVNIFDNMGDFLDDGYKDRENIIGFFLIFFIFFSAIYAGLMKTIFQEQKKSAVIFALAFSILSAWTLISQGIFSLEKFRYVAEGVFFLLLVALIFSLFTGKLGMEKHKFLA